MLKVRQIQWWVPTACVLVAAPAAAAIPTHCKASETAYLSARMSIVQRPVAGGYRLLKTPNVLSLCADKLLEPFNTFVYRYGPIGRPELEQVATARAKFNVFSRSTTPHTGENVISFNIGPNTYCVAEATGMGSGIRLTVIRSGRQVLELFSGNEQDVDFESRLDDIDFERAESPTFRHVLAAAKFRTACDAAAVR